MIKKRTVKRAAKVSILPTTGVLGALIAAFSHDSVRWLADLRHYLASSLNASAVGGNTGAAFYWSIGAGLISYALWPKFRSKVNAWVKGHLSLHHAAVTQSLAEHHASIAALLDEHVAAIHAHIEGAAVTTIESPFVRPAGKRGARESHEPRLLLSQFRVSSTSGAYQEWNGSHGITEWGMDGNDALSDCGAAATDHGNMAKAGDASLLDSLGRPTFAGTIPTYYAYGDAMGEPTAPGAAGPDQGVDNASWLGFLYAHGIIDGYGEVPLGELDQYAQDFNGLLLAVELDDAAEQQFSTHEPWSGTPDPSEGHDVWLIVTHVDGSIEVVTWGAIQACTVDFRLNNITDAWAVLTEEDAHRVGVNWDALKAALDEVHGTVAPAPAPAPAPAAPPVIPPVDPPAVTPEPIVPAIVALEPPVPELEDFLHELSAAAHEVVSVIDRYLHP